jgi:uncharacterized membrane protein YccF (DUF307 family)
MRVIKATLKLILFVVWVSLSLAWMVFFGAVGVAACATVLLVPMGLMSFGLATMPLFAALGWMGLRRPAQQVIVVNR